MVWVWYAWVVGRTRRRARGRADVGSSREGERMGGGVRRGESRVDRPMPRGRTRWGRGRAARATQARGGGTGTDSVRDGGTLASVTGQSAEGETKKGSEEVCSASRSFSVEACSTEEGSCCLAVSFAAATPRQNSQGLAGSKVAVRAKVSGRVRTFSVNILPQAKTCTASSSAPLAQSQAKRREVIATVRRTGRTRKWTRTGGRRKCGFGMMTRMVGRTAGWNANLR